ncbi:MAG: sensor histidine kinase [Bacteroidota bacterium]
MPPVRFLRVIVAAVTIVAIAAFTLSAWRDRQATQRETEGDLREVVRLMEEHTRAALLVGEIQLSRIQDAIGARLPRQMGGAADHDMLVRLSAAMPFFDSAWIFDADGTMRASTHPLPPGGLNVADRTYYTALRDGASGFVSPLIWGRARPEAFVVMSHRVDRPDGRFAGGIEVSLKADYFTDFYHNLNPEPGAVFVIYKDDGSLVMCSALPTNQETFPRPTSILAQTAQQPDGVLTAASGMDGVKRLYAYRHMKDRALVVASGLPVRQVFAAWRDRTQRNALIATLGLMAFWAVAALLERTLRREAALRGRAEALLADKEMLFQEIHHRVKNNLQIIASFLTMQVVHSRDPATAAAFEEALSRLQSMGLVHQILYEQNEATEVGMEAYLRALGTTIGQTFGAPERGISIEVTPSDARLAMDQAVPLALLANEALTNALKHAFPNGRSGVVRMELCRQQGGALAFSLADNGVGMTQGAKSGLGMIILSALARQLGGTLDWSAGPGTQLTVVIPA